MHDHSRLQRDIDDVTGVSLSLYYSQKSLTHNIGSASALPIILPLSRRLLSVFLLPTSAPATFVVCRVREDKINTLAQVLHHIETETERQKDTDRQTQLRFQS